MTRRVGLFVTCLVDLFRPAVGFAAVRLLEASGCRVVVPETQVCCGQPAWNAGDREDARALAERVIDAFDGLDHVVAPSGSCIGMLRQFPEVIERTDPLHVRAQALAERAHELTEFLVDVCGYRPEPRAAGADGIPGAVTYHDSCAGLRECGIKSQPRALLEAVGVEVKEMDAAEVCCGFGGTFCIKYPEISSGMTDDKLASIERSGADLVVGGDLGCLLNIAGRSTRCGKPIRARHVAELLVEGPGAAALGDPADGPVPQPREPGR